MGDHTNCCHGLSLKCDLLTEEVGLAEAQNGNNSSTKKRNLDNAQEHPHDTVNPLELTYSDVGTFDGLIQVFFGFASPLPIDLKDLVPSKNQTQNCLPT
jgi:hypothetical protein